MNRPKFEDYSFAGDFVRAMDEYCCELEYKNCVASNNIISLQEKLNETSNELSELIDKEEKYKWHDLRKNRDDLPKEGEICVVLIKEYFDMLNKEFEYFSYLCTEYKCGKFFIHNTIRDVKRFQVIAWKYIDKFEEEKK